MASSFGLGQGGRIRLQPSSGTGSAPPQSGGHHDAAVYRSATPPCRCSLAVEAWTSEPSSPVARRWSGPSTMSTGRSRPIDATLVGTSSKPTSPKRQCLRCPATSFSRGLPARTTPLCGITMVLRRPVATCFARWLAISMRCARPGSSWRTCRACYRRTEGRPGLSSGTHCAPRRALLAGSGAGPSVRYDLSAQVIDMADLGVPQHRERLIVVGVRRDLGVRPPVIPTPFAGNSGDSPRSPRRQSAAARRA